MWRLRAEALRGEGLLVIRQSETKGEYRAETVDCPYEFLS